MRYHLSIILFAVRAMIIIIIGVALFQLFQAYNSYLHPEMFDSFAKEKFATIGKEAGVHLYALPYFFILYALLLGYLIYVLIQLYRSFTRLREGEVFYDKQATEFRRAGGGIIIFAKCKYLLFCIVGVYFFRSLSVFIAEIPMFLVAYFVGKLILVLYYLAEKGAFLKEETDLTI